MRDRPSTSSFGEGGLSHGNYYAIGLVQLSSPNGGVNTVPDVVFRASRLSHCRLDVIFEPEISEAFHSWRRKNRMEQKMGINGLSDEVVCCLNAGYL